MNHSIPASGLLVQLGARDRTNASANVRNNADCWASPVGPAGIGKSQLLYDSWGNHWWRCSIARLSQKPHRAHLMIAWDSVRLLPVLVLLGVVPEPGMLNLLDDAVAKNDVHHEFLVLDILSLDWVLHITSAKDPTVPV